MLGLCVVSLLGCGKGEYDTRLQATVTNVARRAAIESVLSPSATDASPDSGVRFRLPLVFDSSAKPLAPGDARAKIGAVDIPGLIKANERAIDDPAGKYSVSYVYTAAVPKEGKTQEALQADVQRAIAAVLPNAKWENATVDKLAGGSASYPVLKATGPQIFDATQNGGANEQHEGQLELYLVPADKQWVLIGWRAPTAHATKYLFWNSVKAAMGTVEAGGGAAPAPAAAPAADAAAPAAAAPGAVAPMPMPMPMANQALPPGAVGGAAGIAPLNP
jgi:hypothetical protein